jgi:hypothetical protein
MSVPFPRIKPTGRTASLGTYPIRSFRALSGATFKRSYGNKPSGYELELEYSNVTNDIAVQLLNHYNTTQGGFERFKLPDEVFAGNNSDGLRAILEAPDDIRWEYASPPSVAAVPPDLCSVQIRLIGEQK